MFLLFKDKESKQAEANPALERLRVKINALLKKLAAYLLEKTNQISAKIKLVMLVVFIIASASLSIYVIAASIINTRVEALSVPQIVIPKYNITTEEQRRAAQRLIIQQDYKRIYDLKHYIDSLHQTIAGKHAYDSLNRLRPGLIDTLKLLENIYSNQQKEILWKRKHVH